LSQEQDNLVRLAEKELTKEDRKRIEVRNHTLNLSREGSTLSKGEGPSRDKGKEPDPANWGNLELDDGEVDLDTQRAALESFHLAQDREAANRDEQSEISHSLYESHDDRSVRTDVGDKVPSSPVPKLNQL
jgi:hypothetical protein